MIAVGQRWALRWKYAHRIDVTILDLRAAYIVGDADHRCKPYCYLLREQPATLSLSGPRYFLYEHFAMMYELVPDDAIALTGASHEQPRQDSARRTVQSLRRQRLDAVVRHSAQPSMPNLQGQRHDDLGNHIVSI